MKVLQYLRSIATTKSIRAIRFVFHPGKHLDRATLEACTGWVRHAGNFPESKIYAFVLQTRLSKGSAEVLLLDQQKRPLLRLGEHAPTQAIALEGKGRYYIRWEFQHATGQCELRW